MENKYYIMTISTRTVDGPYTFKEAMRKKVVLDSCTDEIFGDTKSIILREVVGEDGRMTI